MLQLCILIDFLTPVSKIKCHHSGNADIVKQEERIGKYQKNERHIVFEDLVALAFDTQQVDRDKERCDHTDIEY